jgi:hypothetical protein
MSKSIRVRFLNYILTKQQNFYNLEFLYFQEPSGCSLIVQFLYHANMTEQVYNSNINQIGISTPNSPAQNISQIKPSTELSTGSSESSLSITNTTNLTSNLTIVHQNELKVNRIQMLRILAIKTAAILDWNLIIFEKE